MLGSTFIVITVEQSSESNYLPNQQLTYIGGASPIEDDAFRARGANACGTPPTRIGAGNLAAVRRSLRVRARTR